MLRFSFKIASSCIQHFWGFEAIVESTLECCRAYLSWPYDWPECQHSDDLSMLVSAVGMRKKSDGDKSGEYDACCNIVILCIDKTALTYNAQCSHALSCRRNHFSVFAVCPIESAIFMLWFWPALCWQDALHLSLQNIRNVLLLTMHCTLIKKRKCLHVLLVSFTDKHDWLLFQYL